MYSSAVTLASLFNFLLYDVEGNYIPQSLWAILIKKKVFPGKILTIFFNATPSKGNAFFDLPVDVRIFVYFDTCK